MSLEKILERIERDAQNEAEKIKNRATASANELLKKAEAEAEALKSQASEKAKGDAEQRKQRIIATARLDLRKALLAEKQNAIDAAFKEAVESLVNRNNADYRRTLKAMILPHVQAGNEEIILSERDKARLGKGFLKELNSELAKGGKKGNLRISQDKYNMLGGFILRRGKIELNSSFESLFKSSRDELESEVSKILFPES